MKDLIDALKSEVRKKIDDEYTEYKIQCLKDLDYKLELKRNDVIREILNGVDFSVAENTPYSLEPTILIKVEKKVIIKGD